MSHWDKNKNKCVLCKTPTSKGVEVEIAEEEYEEITCCYVCQGKYGSRNIGRIVKDKYRGNR